MAKNPHTQTRRKEVQGDLSKLAALRVQIDQMRHKKAGQNAPSGDDSIRAGIAFGLRLAVEMVSALFIGVGGGYLLDRWLETGPIMVIGGLFLGIAAGVANVWRAVNTHKF
ncbi:MAG: AtpZ/AtpI family protein [Pseudomonadota bacterium]